MQRLLSVTQHGACAVAHTICRSTTCLGKLCLCKQSIELKRLWLVMQVTLCDQLASYLTKFKPAAQSNAAAASSANVVVPQGMQVLKKKGKPLSCLGHVCTESHQSL